MGREVKRVPMDFNCPINETWEGYINPLYVAKECKACCNGRSRGYSDEARRLQDLWYGYLEFNPRDRGSIPYSFDHPLIIRFAERNISQAPQYYGTSQWAKIRECLRLANLFNSSWSHHLNNDDVKALIAADRLWDFTRTWTKETGWQDKDPPYIPTAKEVNDWSISSMGHDSINCDVVVRAECERLGVPYLCTVCGGEGEFWPSEEAKMAFENWERTEPPEGDGWQIWQTVSEGGPISPVFATPEELARHMEGTRWGADEGQSYETWLKFIRGPGWAPSMIAVNGVTFSGVEGSVVLDGLKDKV